MVPLLSAVGAEGIGTASAVQLARAGVALDDTGVRSTGGRTVFLRANVAVFRETAYQTMRREYQEFHFFHCNAGMLRFGTVVATPPELWAEVFNTNPRSGSLACHYGTPLMVTGCSPVVITASVPAFAKPTGVAPYAVSRGSCLARHSGACGGPRVCRYADAVLIDRVFSETGCSGGAHYRVAGRPPAGPGTMPEEVAKVVPLLLNSAGRYVTGATFRGWPGTSCRHVRWRCCRRKTG